MLVTQLSTQAQQNENKSMKMFSVLFIIILKNARVEGGNDIQNLVNTITSEGSKLSVGIEKLATQCNTNSQNAEIISIVQNSLDLQVSLTFVNLTETNCILEEDVRFRIEGCTLGIIFVSEPSNQEQTRHQHHQYWRCLFQCRQHKTIPVQGLHRDLHHHPGQQGGGDGHENRGVHRPHCWELLFSGEESLHDDLLEVIIDLVPWDGGEGSRGQGGDGVEQQGGDAHV